MQNLIMDDCKGLLVQKIYHFCDITTITDSIGALTPAR